uniref:Uncharacterized protein n=1 Tax=Steinernema glaseri TaxID=37863 RepID=A0A1I8AVK3_9BILA
MLKFLMKNKEEQGGSSSKDNKSGGNFYSERQSHSVPPSLITAFPSHKRVAVKRSPADVLVRPFGDAAPIVFALCAVTTNW